jgi:hypothetical protein
LFILLFFPWVGVPGHPDESQSGWGTGFGSHLTSLGLLYLSFFLLALLLALAGVILPRTPVQIPAAVRPVWPWRSAIAGGLALLAFLFLVLELAKGFGLETDIRGALTGTVRGVQEKEVVLEVPAADVLHRTVWMRLAVLVHFVAVAGAVLEFWLLLRKTRQSPRVDLSW